jgi:hypothetical protein
MPPVDLLPQDEDLLAIAASLFMLVVVLASWLLS